MRYFWVLLLLFAGCSEEATRRINAENLAKNGQLVGKLSDGRSVTCYRIARPGGRYDHWLYVVGDTVTVNSVTDGKYPAPITTVIVGGVRYVPEVESVQKDGN